MPYDPQYRLPISLPIRPISALHALCKLLLNKEDTKQTYRILKAISGNAYRQGFVRFINTTEGRRIIDKPVKIENFLGDIAQLLSYPSGSAGYALGFFFKDENLAIDKLITAASAGGFGPELTDENGAFRRYFLHFELSHDIWHVLTGCGRDPLGELCLMAFTRTQWPNCGLAVMCVLGGFGLKLQYPRLPVFAAMKEARRIGLQAKWLLAEPLEDLLTSNIETTRSRLALELPCIYNSAWRQ